MKRPPRHLKIVDTNRDPAHVVKKSTRHMRGAVELLLLGKKRILLFRTEQAMNPTSRVRVLERHLAWR
jgi:hypothetical protein